MDKRVQDAWQFCVDHEACERRSGSTLPNPDARTTAVVKSARERGRSSCHPPHRETS
jgi:hypothetical protein